MVQIETYQGKHDNEIIELILEIQNREANSGLQKQILKSLAH